MPDFEYKTVAAPRRIKKVKGVKGRGESLAAMIEAIIQDESAGGWDYLRTDIFPVDEKPGWFSSRAEVHKGVMVFRRGVPERQVAAVQSAPQPVAQPAAQPVMSQPEPAAPTETPSFSATPEPVIAPPSR
ncbi:MAG: hypothetical protein ACPGGK_05170 [Pikeienuella sp.]